MSSFEGVSAMEMRQVEANAERVRSAVPAQERSGRTDTVYDVAVYMLEVPLRADQIRLVFSAMTWLKEKS